MDLPKLWDQLEPNLLLIYKDFNTNCTKELYMKLYSLIYSYLTISFRKKRLLLFEEFYKKILGFIDSLNSRFMDDINDDNFIKTWKEKYMISQIVNNIFDYFNRTYISKLSTFGKSDFNYIDSFTNSWNYIIMNNKWSSVLVNILSDINVYRNTQNNNINYIIEYSNYLLDIDFLNKDCLYIYLVEPYITNLKEYYSNKSSEIFNSSNIITYIEFINISFKNELELSKKIFDNYSFKIYENCYTILIHDKLEQILINIGEILKNPDSLVIINYIFYSESYYIKNDISDKSLKSYNLELNDDMNKLIDSIINYIKISNFDFFNKIDTKY